MDEVHDEHQQDDALRQQNGSYHKLFAVIICEPGCELAMYSECNNCASKASDHSTPNLLAHPAPQSYLQEIVQCVDLVHVIDPMHHVSVTLQPRRIGPHAPAGGGPRQWG